MQRNSKVPPGTKDDLTMDRGFELLLRNRKRKPRIVTLFKMFGMKYSLHIEREGNNYVS